MPSDAIFNSAAVNGLVKCGQRPVDRVWVRIQRKAKVWETLAAQTVGKDWTDTADTSEEYDRRRVYRIRTVTVQRIWTVMSPANASRYGPLVMGLEYLQNMGSDTSAKCGQ